MRSMPLSRGFSFIEVMMAIVIFWVMVIASTQMQIYSIRGMQTSAELSLATNLATRTLEELKISNYLDTVSSSATTFGKNGISSGTYYTVTWTVTADSTTYKDVSVATTWKYEAADALTRSVTIYGRVYVW